MTAFDSIKNLIDSGHPVAFWGAGRSSFVLLNRLKKMNVSPFAILDNNKEKHGKHFHNIPIMPFDEALLLFPKMYIWVSEGIWKYQVIGQLLYNLKFPSDRIINFEPVHWCKSCSILENEILCTSNSLVKSCCRMPGRKTFPAIKFEGNHQDTIDKFIEIREELLGQIKNGMRSCCEGCSELKETYHSVYPKITTIHFSSGGICNLECKYCHTAAKYSKGSWEEDINLKEVIELLEEKKLLSESYILAMAPGEITLNKNRKQYYQLFKNSFSTNVATNATIYDEDLAECLRNGETWLMISADAGTNETYKKLRGRDLYDIMSSNIIKYSTIAPGTIDLKYIIVPGFNDNFKDSNGFMDLCFRVKPFNVILTYDYYSSLSKVPTQSIETARYMINEIKNRNIQLYIEPYVLPAILNQ